MLLECWTIARFIGCGYQLMLLFFDPLSDAELVLRCFKHFWNLAGVFFTQFRTNINKGYDTTVPLVFCNYPAS